MALGHCRVPLLRSPAPRLFIMDVVILVVVRLVPPTPLVCARPLLRSPSVACVAVGLMALGMVSLFGDIVLTIYSCASVVDSWLVADSSLG